MLLYLLRRIGVALVTFLSVTTIGFLLFNLRAPETIALRLLGPQAANATPEQVAAAVERLGLNRPLLERYLEWLIGVFRGDLGRSLLTGQEVESILGTRVPVTLSIVFLTIVMSIAIGTLVGVLAATRGGVVDRAMQGFAVLFQAIPIYIVALALVIAFSLSLRLFPATGYIPITTSFTGWLSSIFLASASLAIGGSLVLAVWVRSAIIDLRRQDWVRTLRSRGIAPRTIMYQHVLRNAAAPIVQLLGLNIIGLLVGTVFVERIFNLPGLGTAAVTNGAVGDAPIVLGVLVVFVFVIVVINFAVDLINGFLNPKARIT